MTLTFPNESDEYRRARARLLEEEITLRRAMESVAAARRALPPGGEVPRITLSTVSIRLGDPARSAFPSSSPVSPAP